MYFDFSSRPDTLNLRCGNIWLQERRRERSSLIQFSPTRSREEGEGEGPQANNGLSRVGSCSQSVRSPPIFPEVLSQRRLRAKSAFNAIRPPQKSDAKSCCHSALQLWTVTASLTKVRVRNSREEFTV